MLERDINNLQGYLQHLSYKDNSKDIQTIDKILDIINTLKVKGEIK